jgi:hypothetical protein
MITPIGSIARGRGRTRAVAVMLLAVGALAAGCGTASVSSVPAGAASSSPVVGAATSSGTQSASAVPGSTGSGGTSAGASTPGSPTAGASTPGSPAAATPVPTVSGGTVAAGEIACVGWPASAPTGSLPASFVPVSAERCVDAAQTIPGKGLWSTATLERAVGGLAALVSALREPSAGHSDHACPALAMIPPAVVLTSATGQQLIPRLPATSCGLTQSQVLIALDGLHWSTVSVRLIAQISAATTPTATGSPRIMQTVGAGS